MAAAYSAVTQPGLFSHQYPPPLLPKPGKDNARLQKLLKRTAKRKASTQASQAAAPFRSSLSPVNEASPDLEHSDHSTPPRTPETLPSVYGIQQPQRFSIRPPYQHVASPYPQRAVYGKAARLSPQTVAIQSYSYSQHVTTVSAVSPALEHIAQQVATHISLPAETHASLRPVAAPQPKPYSPGLTPYPATGGQAMTRPLIVLTQLVKPKSPRPTFKATEHSRSPKPMFDVPQIRLYTASTSYYETSRTPPVHDTAGLTFIGSTLPPSNIPTETKQGLAPVATPTSDLKRATPTSDLKRATPTSDLKRATPTSDLKRATPTSDLKRATPTSDLKRATPTSELKRATPTSELKRATPTSDLKRATPTSELKRATPTSELRVKTPTYDIQTSRTSPGRPKTSAYHVTRATTPVFEISRPNPLLFAVSPIPVEPERSKTPQTVSAASQSVMSAEPKPPETILNGDIRSDLTPAAKSVQPSITKSTSEPDLTREKMPAAPVSPQRAKTPTLEPAVTSYGYRRPKTPTYEASRLMTTSPGYKRPKTPTVLVCVRRAAFVENFTTLHAAVV
uniref:Proline rich 33 n=1 Tax=Mastacembelus armatus TaxID=205130 RepID=A0A7N8X6B1_9TELE